MSAILLSLIAAVAVLAGVTSWLRRLSCCASRRDLKGQVALVTGAGGDLGRALALELARRGCRLVCVDAAQVEAPNRETADLVRREAGSQDAAVTFTADLRRKEEIQQLAQDVLRDLGGVDVLVSNASSAAFVEGGAVCGCDDQVVDDVLDGNLKATVRLVRALLPHMLERGSGQLVAVSSLLGFSLGISPANPLYCASKAGLTCFMEGVRMGLLQDEQGKNISVTIIHPCLFKPYGALSEEYKYRGLLSPFLRLHSAEQVAARTVRAILEREVFVMLPAWLGMLALACRMLPRRMADLFCRHVVRLERQRDAHLLFEMLSGGHPLLEDPLPMVQAGLDEFVEKGLPLPHDFTPYDTVIRQYYKAREADGSEDVPEAVERFLAAAAAAACPRDTNVEVEVEVMSERL